MRLFCKRTHSRVALVVLVAALLLLPRKPSRLWCCWPLPAHAPAFLVQGPSKAQQIAL